MGGALSRIADEKISCVNPEHEIQSSFLRSTPTYTSVTRTVITRSAFLVTTLVSAAIVISITTRSTIGTISARTNSCRTRWPRGFLVGRGDNLSRKMKPDN